MVNEDTLIAIQCWAGDVDQVERALPQYLHHGCPVVLLSPTDEPAMIDFPGVECRTAGLDAYMGPESLARHHEQLKVLAEYPQKHIMLHEADSMCLEPRIPSYLYEDDNVVWGNSIDTKEHHERNDGMSNYERFPITLQAPWFFTRDALLDMLLVFDAAAKELPDYAKLIDWWFVTAAQLAGLDLKTFPDGISRPIWSLDEVARVRPFVRDGGVNMIHSIKSKEALAILVAARLERA